MSFKELAPISNRLSCEVHALAGQRRFHDLAQVVLDLVLRGRLRAAQRLPQGRELLQVRVKLAVDEAFFQQVTLNLAAGCFRDPLDGNHFRHFEPHLLVDEPAHLRGNGQKLLHVTPVQHKHDQLLSLGAAWARAGRHYLAQLQTRHTLGNRLQVVRIVVLAVDEDDLLGAPGDVQVAGEDHTQVAGLQPVVGGEGFGVGLRVFVIARRYVGAADVDVTDATLRQWLIIIAGNPYAAERDRHAF